MKVIALDPSSIKGTKAAIFQVVVVIDENNLVGFVVEQIVDIVEQEVKIKGTATEKGIDYLAVIQEKLTEILDVEEVIKMANLKFLSNFKAQLPEKQVTVSI